MNARSHAAHHEHPGEDSATPAIHEHPQMEASSQASDVMFRGLETIRKIQERAAREALARHSAVATKWKPPVQPANLMLAHAQLLSDDVNAASRAWQEIGAVALEMQAELAACCTQLVESDQALQAAALLRR